MDLDKEMPDLTSKLSYLEAAVAAQHEETAMKILATAEGKKAENQAATSGIELALREQIEQMQHELEVVKEQADAQKAIAQTLEKEAKDRAHDDKKYFWLGALVSLITSLIVEHGAELIAVLQQLFLQ